MGAEQKTTSPKAASRQRRKARKQARVEAEKRFGPEWGFGGRLQAMQDNRLIRQSLRWNTRVKGEEIDDADARQLEAHQVALQTTRKNMLSPDPDVANTAVMNLIRMEAQNQSDEHKLIDQEIGEKPPQVVRVVIENRKDKEDFLSMRDWRKQQGQVIDVEPAKNGTNGKHKKNGGKNGKA